MVEILEIYSLNDEDAEGRKLLRSFYDLYELCFPDPNERESLDQWFSRLNSNHLLPPRSLTFILVAVEGRGKIGASSGVLGGIVVEFYRRSGCGFITYIAVNPNMRRVGLARLLVTSAKKSLYKKAANLRIKIRAVVGECNDPRNTLVSKDSLDPTERLKILSHLGALWVNFPYVQPALGEGKQRVRSLLFIVFPSANNHSCEIRTGIVRDFITEFYEDMGVSEPVSDPDVEIMFSSLPKEGTIRLRSLLELVS